MITPEIPFAEDVNLEDRVTVLEAELATAREDVEVLIGVLRARRDPRIRALALISSNVRAALSNFEAEERRARAAAWNYDMSAAPRDRLLWVRAVEGGLFPKGSALPPIETECQWHDDAGFCVCPIREVIAWKETA